MTRDSSEIHISYEITEGAGDLYLATLSLLALREMLVNKISQVEIVISDTSLAEDARQNWSLISEFDIEISNYKKLRDRTTAGFLISGAPIILPTQVMEIEGSFELSDNKRVVMCSALVGGVKDQADIGTLLPLPASLPPSGQAERDLFPGISSEKFFALRNAIRRHHHNGYFWDYRYRSNPALGSGVGSRGLYQTIKRELLNRNIVSHGLSVVDIGCGDLEVCRHLSFQSYLGVDQARQAIALAKRKRPDWDFILAPLDLSSAPFGEVAICFEVIIHAPSREAAVALIHTLVTSASKRIIVSGYDHPVPESSIVYFHGSLREMLREIPGWREPVLLTRYENLSVYAMDREDAGLPKPEHFDEHDAHSITWDALSTLQRAFNSSLPPLADTLPPIREFEHTVDEPPSAEDEQPADEPLASPTILIDAPIVSIIVPYKNEQKRIGNMLRSIANQGEPAFEVHLIDDGSNDQSNNIASSFATVDERFIHWENSDNLGPSLRRNQGIEAARGKYILFVDGDDELSPNALETLLDLSLQNRSDVVRGSHLFHTGKGEGSINAFDQFHQPDLNGVSYSRMPSLVFLYTSWNMLIDRTLLIKNGLRFDETLKLGEDRLFNQNLFSASNSISLTKKNTYRWIREKNSDTQLSFSKSLVDRANSIFAYLSFFEMQRVTNPRHRELAQAAMFWEVWTYLLDIGSNQHARTIFSHIISLFDFPEDLLQDHSIKGWSFENEGNARRLYHLIQRNASDIFQG